MSADLAAYLKALGGLTPEQWGAARQSGRRVAESARNKAARADCVVVVQSVAWQSGRDVARLVAGVSAKKLATNAGCDAGKRSIIHAALAAEAIIVRDLITDQQFETLTIPMRAAGIDFDQLEAARVSP